MQPDTKFILLGAEADLVGEVAGLLHGRGDLADCIVVFPGRRPAHFLRKFLFEKSGKSFEPPAIYSMEEFVSYLAKNAGITGPEINQLDAAAIMRGLETGVSGLGPLAGQSSTELDWFLPWAFKAFSDFEELKKELKTPRELAGFDSALLEDETPRQVFHAAREFSKKFGGFSRLYEAFYAELANKELLTPAMKYAAVSNPEIAGKAGLEKRGLVIMAGFFLLSKSERRLIENLFELPNFRLIAQDGPELAARYKFLAAKGLIGGLPSYRSTVPEPAKFSFHKAPDTHSEVFALGAVMDRQKHAEESVIVIPSADALFPVAHNVLPDFPEYNIAIGYPISHTPVYSLVDSLGKLLDRAEGRNYFIPDYLRLIFHPYIKNVTHAGSPELTRILFQVLQEHFLSAMGRYVSLPEIENDKIFLSNAIARLAPYKDYGAITTEEISRHLKKIHDTVILPFEEIRTIGDFAGKLLKLISFISTDTTANRHPYWAHFSGRFLSLLDQVCGSRLASESFGARHAYFRFFEMAVTGVVYPFSGTPVKGLQVLGLLETRGLKFKKVYFMDANADTLNVSGKEDAVLSDFMRAMLGLASCRDREAERKYYFEILLRGADKADIFYRDNSRSEKSPFVEELLFRLESGGSDTSKLEQKVFFDLTFKNKEPQSVKKTAWMAERLAAMSFSPSAINHYLACPLRFYFFKVLGLKEPEEVSEEISRAHIGNIVHTALEYYFLRGKLGKKFQPEKLKDELALLNLCLRESLAHHGMTDTDKGYGFVMRRQVEKRLEDILRFHADKLSGFTPLAVEAKFEAELMLGSGKKVRLQGLADRIDLRSSLSNGESAAAEKLVIVDYKTGVLAKAPSWSRFDLTSRADWPKTLISVQLPVYVLMALEGQMKLPEGAENLAGAALEGRSVADIDARLMLLGSQEIKEEDLYKPYRKQQPDIEETYKGYREAICILLEEILDPDLPFTPTNDEKECLNCPFKTLCGRL